MFDLAPEHKYGWLARKNARVTKFEPYYDAWGAAWGNIDMAQGNVRRISRRFATTAPNPLFVALESQLYAALVNTPDITARGICDLYITERLSGYSETNRRTLLERMPGDIQALAESRSAGQPKLGPTELDLLDFVLNCKSNRLLFVIGRVGAGKTTFLQYVLQTIARELESLKRYTLVYLNALAFPTNSPSNRDLLNELHRAVARSDPTLLDKGDVPETDAGPQAEPPLSEGLLDSEAHEFVGLVQRLADRLMPGSEPVVVFDNLDHLDVDAVAMITVLARALHISTSVSVIVALRPGMFHAQLEHASGRSGFLPFYITITPPDLRPVIRARLRSALRDYNPVHTEMSGGFRLSISDPEKSVNSICDKLLKPKSQEAFMEGICGNNVRKALAAFAYFCRYRNLDFRLLFALDSDIGYADGGGATIHGHWDEHFLDGLMIGDRQYYADGQGSPITNVLIFEDEGQSDHLILYVALGLLNASGQYVKALRLLNWLVSLGYERTFAFSAIRHLWARSLVSALNGESKVEFDTHLRISAVGTYYIHQLISSPQYLKNVVYDVPLRHALWSEAVRDKYVPQLGSVCELVELVSTSEHARLASDRLTALPVEISGALYGSGLLSRRLVGAALALAESGERARSSTTTQRQAAECKERLLVVEARIQEDEKIIESLFRSQRLLPEGERASRVIEGRLGSYALRMTIPTPLAPALQNRVTIELDAPEAEQMESLVCLWQSVEDENLYQELIELRRRRNGETFQAEFPVTDVREAGPFPQSKLTVFAATRPVLVYKTEG